MKKLLSNILLAIVGFICFLIAVLCIWYIIDVLPFFNNSENAIAELNELKDCHEGKCDAVYLYFVDENEYFINKRNIDEKYHYKKIKIYYKIDEPSVYNSGDASTDEVMLLFSSIVLILIIIILIAIVKRLTNYYYKKHELKNNIKDVIKSETNSEVIDKIDEHVKSVSAAKKFFAIPGLGISSFTFGIIVYALLTDTLFLTFNGVDTKAYFSHVDSCSEDGTTCMGIYVYTVDGHSIEIKEEIFSEEVYYPTIDVRYSKNNPNVNTQGGLIVDWLLLIFLIIIFLYFFGGFINCFKTIKTFSKSNE